MLKELMTAAPQQIDTGVITENMLDGYYRVDIGGKSYVARNQAATTLATGAVVSVASTVWGRFIVSAAAHHAADIPTIIIRG